MVKFDSRFASSSRSRQQAARHGYRRLSSVVEQLLCKHQVVGSNPTGGSEP